MCNLCILLLIQFVLMNCLLKFCFLVDCVGIWMFVVVKFWFFYFLLRFCKYFVFGSFWWVYILFVVVLRIYDIWYGVFFFVGRMVVILGLLCFCGKFIIIFGGLEIEVGVIRVLVCVCVLIVLVFVVLVFIVLVFVVLVCVW